MRCWVIFTVILLSLLMTGCSRISLSDVATTAGATGGAAVGAVIGGVPAVVVGTVAGGVGGAAVVEDSPNETEILETIPEEDRAAVAKTQAFWNFVEHFLEWIIGAVVVLIVIAWLIPGPQFKFKRRENNG